MQHQPFHLRLIASSGMLLRPLVLGLHWVLDLVLSKFDLPSIINSSHKRALPSSSSTSPLFEAVLHAPRVVFTRLHVPAISAAFFWGMVIYFCFFLYFSIYVVV
jgi:hypothetical protein